MTRTDPNRQARASDRPTPAFPALVLALAGAKLLLHLASAGAGAAWGYGFFVDELYYLATADHLAWGFVDMPPLVPALTALVRATLGDSLLALRLVPALAGAVLVLVTARIARRLGGRPGAQALAALAVVVAPVRLAIDSFHSMNALEPLFWMGAALLVLHLLEGGDRRGWLLFGALAGVGLLNKHSMAFFGFALVVGLLATPARRVFRERWIWLGGLVAAAIFLPNLAWMASHGFPHFEMLENIRANGRNVELEPLGFLAQQALALHPVALPLWLGGLAWLVAGRSRPGGAGPVPRRVLGIAYLAVLALMLVLDGRVYYLAPAYPMLFAAGATALEGLLARRAAGGVRRAAPAAYAAVLALTGALLAPFFVPLLPPEGFVRYRDAVGFDQPRIETHRLGPLPQLFADRFGWPEMAAEVARVHRTLPPAEREAAAVFGQNYGQAGAIDRFGPALGLPKAVSGHLAYHDWGPRGHSGEVVIVLGDQREVLEGHFVRVELAGRVDHPYSMPYQRVPVWICRDLRVPLAEAWPALRQLG